MEGISINKSNHIFLMFCKMSLLSLFVTAISASVLVISCIPFNDRIPIWNDTNWEIQVCFSSDGQTANGAWTTIPMKKTKSIPVDNGYWYISVKSDDISVPVNARCEDDSTAFPPETINIRRNKILSITISFQEETNARYIYTVESINGVSAVNGAVAGNDIADDSAIKLNGTWKHEGRYTQTWTFTGNNVVCSFPKLPKIKGTFTVDGEVLTLNIPDETINYRFTVSPDGETLTITHEGSDSYVFLRHAAQ